MYPKRSYILSLTSEQAKKVKEITDIQEYNQPSYEEEIQEFKNQMVECAKRFNVSFTAVAGDVMKLYALTDMQEG